METKTVSDKVVRYDTVDEYFDNFLLGQKYLAATRLGNMCLAVKLDGEYLLVEIHPGSL